MKILLVEDEEKLADAIARGLTANGYTVDTVHDGKRALSRILLHRNDYDLVVLDLMLPSLDGLEICKTARDEGVVVPILILTARSEVEKKVDLLRSGADDYLVKPFSFAELSARIQALLRRPNTMVPEVLKAGDIEMNVPERRVTRDGKKISLTLKEFGILEHFLRHPDEVVNREDLLSHLWDFNYSSFSNVVDVHVKNLRKKLGDTDPQGIVETVRGIGYRLRA